METSPALTEVAEATHGLAARVEADGRFELMAPAPFSTACFPYCAPRRSPGKYDEARLAELTAVILDAVNASGAVYLSHTALRGSYALRLAVGNLRTTERHIDQAWAAVASSADRLPIH